MELHINGSTHMLPFQAPKAIVEGTRNAVQT